MNMQWSGQLDMQNRFVCVVQGDNISQLDNVGKAIQIGYTSAYVEEIVKVAQEYKQICIDNGLIEVEKTPEQIQADLMATIAKQNEAMQGMMEVVIDMQKKVEVLENGRNSDDSTSVKNVGSRPKKTNIGGQSGEAVPDKSTEPESSK